MRLLSKTSNEMTQANLPVIEARELVRSSGVISQVGFLGGEGGREINEEIRAKYRPQEELWLTNPRKYQDEDMLMFANYHNEVIMGANIYYILALNGVIKQQELRVATPSDLGKIIKGNVLDLKGCVEESALILRWEDDPRYIQEDPNFYLERDLKKQIEGRRKNNDEKIPLMIPLSGLELRMDQDFKYGLAFNLTDESEIIYSPQLHIKNYRRSFSDVDPSGLPIFDKNGNRTLENGSISNLSKLRMNPDLVLTSFGCTFDGYNGDDGRVVVIGDKK